MTDQNACLDDHEVAARALAQSADKEDLSIHMHAFIADECGEHHCDEYDPAQTGWAIYLRMETPNNPTGEPFDICEDADFATRDAAWEGALALAAKYGLTDGDIEIY